MIQTEFLLFLRDVTITLRNTFCYYEAVAFGDAWPFWQDGSSALDCARYIADHS